MPGFKHFNNDLHGRYYRTEHPDFKILQDLKKELWRVTPTSNPDDVGEVLKDTISSYVDFDSLTAYCSSMVDDMTDALGLGEPPVDIRAMLVTLVAGGFLSGIEFQERKTNG